MSTSSSLSASMDPVSILTLLVSPSYLLAYTLPLLFLSLILTFAGAFLTLDRTRFFKQKDTYVDVDMPGGMGSTRGRFERWFKMQGGLGGLIGGWSFGFHLVTFMALVIPSLPDSKISKPLSPASFLAVYLLTSLVTAFLGGRFKYAALAMAGLTGGLTFALVLSVITHPTLLTRQVLLAIATPILLLFTLLPLVKFQHGALRFALSSTGAFGLVTSFALLASLKGGELEVQAGVWWSHLFVKDGFGWNTAKEKGLCAGYCLFLLVGSVTDWALRRRFGECPDEKWDSYLASFTTSGNLPDRAGTYTPFKSIWDRLTKSHATEKDPIIFPDDSKGRSSPLPLYEYPTALKDGGQLKKPREKRRSMRQGTRRNRETVKFRPLSDADGSSDNDGDELWDKEKVTAHRPWLRHASSTASSTPTLVGEESFGGVAGFKTKKIYDLDPSKRGQLRKPPPITLMTPPKMTPEYEIDYDKEIRQLREKKVKGMGEGEVPEYSDHSDFEDDITAIKEKGRGKRVSDSFDRTRKMSLAASSNSSGSTVVEHSPRPPSLPVPATPSLIKALDRVAMAQKDAFAVSGLPSVTEEERKEGRGQRWEVFWKEVQERTSKEDLK
ncbi:hypothetical protein E1B28_009586 [Marasmius oreades]|uniref:DUF4203 domain-containing protein n=1 Tax=Marasmius oreades TaxID=181124 RepID=A0A9P7RW26_9AGAR|nr:uncharacterized protein E1B28_009586 [Marasmius oreades]KAG7090472.1 hypothetical protein E1B28_009586 [Marasmius oreades]